MRPVYTSQDFHHSPMVAFYEVTQACDLACRHCRASAQAHRHPLELSREQALALVEELASFPMPPLLVLTGGDPLKREDIFDLVRAARQHGLTVAMTPSATPLVTREALGRLRDMGLHRLAVSLDGADAAGHDAFRRVAGSYDRTVAILRDAQALDLPRQINTTITRDNLHQIDDMARLVGQFDIELWSVFFLVPVGRGLAERRILPHQYEEAFERLWHHSRQARFAVKATEAPHYRRYVLQHHDNPQRGEGRAPLGVNDGRGVLFVSHQGVVSPSGFLPLPCGRFPRDSVVKTYQEHPTFLALRDPDRLGGKCGRCEFRRVCGGSRARTYALTGDMLAEEMDCVYQPQVPGPSH